MIKGRFMKYLYILIFLSGVAFNTTANPAIGKIVMVKGQANSINNTGEETALKRRSEIFEGDTLVTQEDSKLQIRFADNALLAIKSNSTIKISEYHLATDKQQERVLLNLVAGGFRTITGSIGKTNKEDYEVSTPAASIGIRGTNYELSLNNGNLAIGVYNGGIQVENPQGSITLGVDAQYSFAQVAQDQAPIGQLHAPDSLKDTIVIEKIKKKEDNSKSDQQETETPQNNDTSKQDSNINTIVDNFDSGELNTDIEEINTALEQGQLSDSPLSIDLTQNTDEVADSTSLITETDPILEPLVDLDPSVTTIPLAPSTGIELIID
jgi:hypothetical protein